MIQGVEALFHYLDRASDDLVALSAEIGSDLVQLIHQTSIYSHVYKRVRQDTMMLALITTVTGIALCVRTPPLSREGLQESWVEIMCWVVGLGLVGYCAWTHFYFARAHTEWIHNKRSLQHIVTAFRLPQQ